MDDLEIRPGRPEDLEPTVAVWERARWQAVPWLEERMNHTHEDNLRHFRDVVMRRNQVWLALRRGQIVGLLALARGSLDQLYVDPRFQGTGIGSRLLDRAKELSPGGLTLYTHQRNGRARAFYERRGFSVVRLGTSPPPESEPDVQYEWRPGPGARTPVQRRGR